jgi:hypothetical protein
MSEKHSPPEQKKIQKGSQGIKHEPLTRRTHKLNSKKSKKAVRA